MKIQVSFSPSLSCSIRCEFDLVNFEFSTFGGNSSPNQIFQWLNESCHLELYLEVQSKIPMALFSLQVLQRLFFIFLYLKTLNDEDGQHEFNSTDTCMFLWTRDLRFKSSSKHLYNTFAKKNWWRQWYLQNYTVALNL